MVLVLTENWVYFSLLYITMLQVGKNCQFLHILLSLDALVVSYFKSLYFRSISINSYIVEHKYLKNIHLPLLEQQVDPKSDAASSVRVEMLVLLGSLVVRLLWSVVVPTGTFHEPEVEKSVQKSISCFYKSYRNPFHISINHVKIIR